VVAPLEPVRGFMDRESEEKDGHMTHDVPLNLAVSPV
jgi:hypothetical protein